MQNNRFSHASRILAVAATGLGLLLAGCGTAITNLTPAALPQNPSQIYTLSARVTPQASTIVPGSLVVHIVIDGQDHQMTRSELGEGIFTYDHQAAAGSSELKYYILADYDTKGPGGVLTHQEDYIETQHASISGRYILQLETNRGTVGAPIGVIGRGFTAQDVVYVGPSPARTVFESANALSFYVPALEGGRNYEVQLVNPTGSTFAGTFRVDTSSVSVTPAALTLRQGETQPLTFTLATPATSGGVLLDVTTDAAESVIMPEVLVPAGSARVTVNVTGGKPGSGSLFLKGFGSGEVVVPVTVTQ